MKKQNIILTLAFSLLSLTAFAQSSLPFNEQYFLMDKFLVNPSFTGASDDIVFKASHKRQWDNMPESPTTTLASVHANIVDRVGLGMYFMNDHNGNTKTNSFNLSAAYHIPFGNKKNRQQGQFSFGTSLSFAGMHFQGFTENPYDPIYNDNETRVYIPYINFGASATYDGWMIGVSVLDIPLSYNNPIVNEYEPSPKFYYGMLGKTINASSQFEIEPMVAYRSNFDEDSRFDANLRAKYKFNDNAVWLGANYRMDFFNGENQALSVSPMIGVEIGRMNMGFSYNMGLGDTKSEWNNGFTAVLGFNVENFFKPNFE
ncbi:MAG: PorP/SprF family type IX secretion system membrane protein [Weeksellaceae bacterium]|nr:PorP/SprF family type IX secretion system membrane protein [Weeksellaceae bacterium]MDX9704119.1 PorP/SprF family type IX secretion system membrane protein [Weeksellaceae bacterium]